MRRVLNVGLALFLLAGCVKEERGDCPCYLTLNLDAVVEEGKFSEAVTTLTPSMDRGTDRDLVNLEKYETSGYEKKVRRELVSVSVICGQKNALFCDEDCLRFEVYAQADPIMAYAGNVLCDSDRATADVVLHKQYCRICFLKEGTDSGEEYPYRMRVTAAYNGMNIYDLSPVEGVFIADAVTGDSGNPSVVIPRQKGSSVLRLDIMSLDGVVQCSIDLGVYFSRMAYDWEKEDLDDVDLKIDYTKAQVEIGIIPWEANYETIDI